MRGILDEIHARGAELVVIGSGAPFMAKAFVEDLGLTTPVYSDASLASYAIAGMKRGLLATINPKGMFHAWRAFRAGHRQTATRGDALQQGGVLVIAKGGEILYVYRDNEAGDHAPIEDVAAAVRQLSRANQEAPGEKAIG